MTGAARAGLDVVFVENVYDPDHADEQYAARRDAASTTIDAVYSIGEPAPIATRYGATVADVSGKTPRTSPTTESPAEIAAK